MSQTSSFSLPIGPVHVALEEPVYFHLDVDGETVRKVEITSGHVHRGMEGMATQRNFFKNTTLTERVCSLCSNSHSLTYCMAVENVLGMTPPPRAQYLRVLAEETKRVASHLFNIAIFAHNVGFKSLFLHIMEVRENMQDVKETIYGNRMNLSANCIGGVKFDMDDSLTVYMLERLDTVEEAVKRVEKVFRTDPLIAKRSRGVGVLSREDAWTLGVVGPVARGSGLDIDVRKNTPYLVYPDLYFDIVKEQDGDVWSRAMVRVREVFESIRLLRQCLDKLPEGPLAVHMERIPESESTAILRAAYEAGINFYDTANAYTDSEFKLGQALGDVRRNIIIATKTAPAAPEVMQQHLEQSLKMLRTDYIDIYQLHCAPRVYRPGEEDGVYDWLLQKKKEGAIRHISVTAHRIGVAEEALESGLYDTLQYPFSVIADERELRLAQRARELDIGFIAMKAMAGGLIQHPEVTFAFLRQYPQVVPIYGIQRMSELNQWLSLENDPPQWNEEMQRLAAEEKAALGGDFCRSCGYCMPCPMGIEIPNAARMSLLMTRAPYQPYITKEWQAKMHKIESCINCRRCVAHCPYSLDTPRLLRDQLHWYENFCQQHRSELG